MEAAELLLLTSFGEVENAVAPGDPLTDVMRARMRAAAVYATNASREAATCAHLAAGTTAIREGSRLECAFRDIYTGTQHAFLAEKVAGRLRPGPARTDPESPRALTARGHRSPATP